MAKLFRFLVASGREGGRYRPRAETLRELAGVLGVSCVEPAVLAGYADPPGVEDEAAADGRWFARLLPELRRWLRAVAELHPGGGL